MSATGLTESNFHIHQEADLLKHLKAEKVALVNNAHSVDTIDCACMTESCSCSCRFAFEQFQSAMTPSCSRTDL